MIQKIQQRGVNLWQWAKAFFWRRQALYGALLIGLLIGVVWQLSAIPPNAALLETTYVEDTRSLSSIVDNPLSLPHKASTFVALQVSDSVRIVRAVSIVFFGLTTLALYRILKRWHSDKIALFGAAMFASNATVLAISRLGTPLVLLFCWSLILSIALWIRHGKSRHIAPIVLVLASTLLLYVPGAPYFFIFFLLLFGNKVRAALKQLKRSSLIVGIAIGIIIIAPLILSLVQNTETLKAWLLLPSMIDWSEVPGNILRVPSAFIYRAPIDPLISLGRLPVFDVASGGFFLVGLYAYQRYIKLERTRVMLVTASLAIVLGALGQVLAAIVILLPYVYMVIAAGISYVLDQWYAVFPRNPFARSFGLLLVTIIVVLSMYYQIYRFFVVWPQTPATRAVYDQSRLVE